MKTLLAILLGTALLPTLAQAQSCNSRISASTPNAYFQVTNDEVMDFRTNLIWQRCAIGQTWDGSSCTGASTSHTWQQALSAGNGTNWRLPNIKELLSLVEVSCNSPAINTALFPNTESLFFWTSSPYVNNNQAWLVSFNDGNDEGADKATGRSVRLVRDVGEAATF